MESLGVNSAGQYLLSCFPEWGKRQVVQAPERIEAGRPIVAYAVYFGDGTCWRKNQNTEIRGQMFAESRKVNQACQSIWPEIDKGENKVKFESVSAGISNISQMGVSASFADTIDDKKILNESA